MTMRLGGEIDAAAAIVFVVVVGLELELERVPVLAVGSLRVPHRSTRFILLRHL